MGFRRLEIEEEPSVKSDTANKEEGGVSERFLMVTTMEASSTDMLGRPNHLVNANTRNGTVPGRMSVTKTTGICRRQRQHTFSRSFFLTAALAGLAAPLSAASVQTVGGAAVVLDTDNSNRQSTMVSDVTDGSDDDDGFTAPPSVSPTSSPTISPTFQPTSIIPTPSPSRVPTIDIVMPQGPIPSWLGFDQLVLLDRELGDVRDKVNVSTYDLVKTCTDAMHDATQSLIKNDSDQAAYNMFNAWGVYPQSQGNFYACTTAGHSFCSMNLSHSYNSYNAYVCVPSICTARQIDTLRGVIISNKLKDVTEYDFGDTNCIESDLDGMFPLVAMALGFVAGVAAIATVIDIVLRPADKELPYRPLDEASRITLMSINDVTSSNSEAMVLSDVKLSGKMPENQRSHSCGYTVGTFSIIQSFRHLIAPPPYGQSMRTLDGIRVISMLWIIFGQTMMVQMPILDSSEFIVAQLRTQFWFQMVANASFATDTFLFVSGFLAMYKLLQRFSRRSAPNGVGPICFAVLSTIAQRASRLLPLNAVVMVIYIMLLPSLLEGPYVIQWTEHSDYADCANGWWQNLVFVNNLIDSGDNSLGCMGWTWYVSLDMQLHVLAPIIGLLFWYYGLLALLVTIVSTILAVGSTVWTIKANDLAGCPSDYFNERSPEDDLLTKPWTRAVPFLLGFILAFWLNAVGDEYGARNISRLRPVKRTIFYVITGLLIGVPTFVTVDMRDDPHGGVGTCNWSSAENFAYLTLSRLSFSIGIFMLVLSCLTGWAGRVANLLSMASWTPLSRLTYGVYLVHPLILETVTYTDSQTPQYTNLRFIMMYSSTVIVSFAVSAFLYVLFDRPIYNILRSCSQARGQV